MLTPLGNQKTLRRTLKKLPFKDVPSTSWGDVSHGRRVRRTARGGLGSHLGGLPRSGSGGPGPAHPNHQGSQARMVAVAPRGRLWRWSTRVCSLPMGQAQPEQVAAWVRGHWKIENRLHVGP